MSDVFLYNYTLLFIFLKQGLSLNLEIAVMAILARQQISRVLLSRFPSAGWGGDWGLQAHHAWLSNRC